VTARHRLIAPDHFGGLLVLIVSLVVLAPLIADRRAEGPITGLITGLLLVGALVASGTRRGIVVPAAGTAAVLVALAGTGGITTDGATPGWVLGIITAMLATTPVLVLRRVLQHRQVTLSTVAGAVCAYLLVGIVFGALYRTIETVDGDAFAPPLESAATYFSFVTLATVGFGDFVATSDFARSLVILEAVTGQVLLVTLVARFVSTLGQQRVIPPRHGSPDVHETDAGDTDVRPS